PVREIPISALDDAGFQALLQRAQAAHPAHTFRFLDVTSEVGLPAVWAQAVGPPGDGLRTLNATAAGFSTAAACRSALRELIGFFGARFTFAQRRAEAETGLADPFQIRTIEDHGAVAALDAAFERFAFTYEDPTPAPVVDLLAGQTQIDLNGLIEDLTRRLAGLGSEAVFVPLTLPGYAARGLHTARVLATELFPLTFGHQERRLAHRPRAASLNLSPTAPPHPLL
ncbi:MAG: YcaO-like family protein, partial [Bacteroidota bacterium]